jgi:exosortase D (VPLPA-CTERM-specific)
MASNAHLRSTVPGYALLGVAVAAALLLFAQALQQMYEIWNLQPEYSYGILIPLLSLFLIWRDRDRLRGQSLTGSWYGLLLIAPGLALRVVGQFSTMPTLVHYALLMVLYGLVLSLAGPALFRRLLMPLLVLIFMVPLPPFFSEQLSLQLQLLSSQIGVWFIRAAGISVYLQGNVIDLGNYQLEVAQACSGLRYLFPLMTLAFLIGYVYRGPWWKRAVVFLASIPITVFMNSLRIGLIGVTVDYWGPKMAEGFLHEFEGWVVFMLSSLVLFAVAIALAKPWRGRKVAAAAAAPLDSNSKALPAIGSLGAMPRAFIAATAMVAAGAILEYTIPERPEVVPARQQFVDFPLHIDEWNGRKASLDPDMLALLALDDYLLVDYSGAGTPGPLNFYVAYYQSQKNGMSIHSPARCIPGGGWNVLSFERHALQAPAGAAGGWPVNRVLIEQGNQRALVYYWFQERHRRLTSEYLARWYLFWDSLHLNRTDGALVRLVLPLRKDSNLADADALLTRFAFQTKEPLSHFVSD